jgi:chemotaxis protein CheX
MKVEYANVFVSSAMEVIQKEVGVHLSRMDLSKKGAPTPSRPISIIVGITGFIKGQVVYSMDNDFAYGVTRAMMPNNLPINNKALVNSAISELANMITGKASIALAGGAEKLDLTPPAVLMASDLTIDFMVLPTLCLRLLSEIGILEINLALTEPKGGEL